MLYKSEVRTLSAIGHNSGINLTSLSIEMNVSKSAVSKFVGKLLERMVTKSTFSGIYDLLAHLTQEEKIFLTSLLNDLNRVLKNSLDCN